MAEETQKQPSKKWGIMTPLLAPHVPGNTEAKRFDNVIRKMFKASKREIERRGTEWQRTNGRRTLPRKESKA